MVRKLMLILLFLVVAGVSTWLRFGDLDAPRRWLAGLSLPKREATAPAPAAEESLPVRQSFSGGLSVPRDGLLVVHFRRADGAEDAVAKGAIRLLDSSGKPVKELTLWGNFRRETPAGASMARYAIGGIQAGSYQLSVDLASAQTLGVKKAAAEIAIAGYDSLWIELPKGK